VPSLVSTGVVDAAGLAAVLSPRTGAVLERAVGDREFALERGAVTDYRRHVEVEARDDGRFAVRQHVTYRLPLVFFRWLYGPLTRREMRRLVERPGMPWWLPAERLDGEAARTLDTLAVFALVVGYLVALVPQTFTYVAHGFGVGLADQGVTLATLRADALLSLPLVALADRHGRRRLLVVALIAACLATATGALVPSLGAYTASQLVARGFVNAGFVLLPVLAVEAMPAGARAWAIGQLVMAGALGGGLAVALRPLSSTGPGWRLLYVVPLLALPCIGRLGRRLPESRAERAARHGRVSLRGHGRRLLLLAAGALLVNAFLLPVAQFQNEFLRVERGFGPGEISLFTLLTGVPGAIGVLVGGRIADVRGRRLVLAISTGGFAVFTVAAFLSPGAGLWLFAVVASVVGGAIAPTLGAYGPELFPAAMRGVTSGVLSGFGRAGSVIGLLAMGFLGAQLGRLSLAVTVLAVGPLLLGVLVLAAYPETAGRSLEELNPEDADATDNQVVEPAEPAPAVELPDVSAAAGPAAEATA
jgi:MFS family permease